MGLEPDPRGDGGSLGDLGGGAGEGFVSSLLGRVGDGGGSTTFGFFGAGGSAPEPDREGALRIRVFASCNLVIDCPTSSIRILSKHGWQTPVVSFAHAGHSNATSITSGPQLVQIPSLPLITLPHFWHLGGMAVNETTATMKRYTQYAI